MNSFRVELRHACAQLLWAGLICLGVRKGDIYRFLGKSKLTDEQRRLLQLMRGDNALSESPYKAGEFWLEMNRSFDSWLETEGIFEVESQTINEYLSGHRPQRLLNHASWLLYHNLKARDKWGILGKFPATASKESGLGYDIDGAYVSWDLLISLDTLFAIAEIDESILTEPVTVLDLGSGWGRIGYALKSVNPRSAYIACDLPEGLLISSTYLPRLLPKIKVFHYPESSKVESFTKESLLHDGGMWFCGPQDIPRFADKSVDFFINVASFQEMTRGQVDQYFGVIDRIVGGLLYIQEYWDGLKMGHTEREISGYMAYPFRTHWKRRYLRSVSFSDLYFEAVHAVNPARSEDKISVMPGRADSSAEDAKSVQE